MINCCELGKINNSSDFQDYETKAGASVVGLEFIELGAGRQMFWNVWKQTVHEGGPSFKFQKLGSHFYQLLINCMFLQEWKPN